MAHVAFGVGLVVCLLGILTGSFAQEYRDGQYTSSTRLFGVTYSPLALNLDEICLPVEDVQVDMAIIREVADHVRLYGLAVCKNNTEVRIAFDFHADIWIVY